MKIMLVEDHVLFREGLKSLIDAQPDLSVVAEAGSVKEAIKKAKEHLPELVLMDIGLPDGSGLDATKAILSAQPDTTVLIITIHEGDNLLIEAVRAGAKGYLLKNIQSKNLLAAIRGIERGEAAISRRMTYRVLDELTRVSALPGQSDSGLEQLTPREMEILKEVGKGYSNREIAKSLFISENTVKTHVYAIYRKLNLENRQAAQLFARLHGLLDRWE